MLEGAFHHVKHTLCYSVKANSNLSILRLLAGMGAGFDIVSGGELERVRRAHKKSLSKVVFSGVGKTADELRLALRSGILLFNVESEGELELLAACAAELRKVADIALRVNPDVPAETHPVHFHRPARTQIWRAHQQRARALPPCRAAQISSRGRRKPAHWLAN